MATSRLIEIERRRAAMIESRWFTDFNYIPAVGDPIPCKAWVGREQDLQPAGYDRITDTQLDIVIFRKEVVPLNTIDPGAIFEDLTDNKKYYVQAVAPDDQDIFGKVIVNCD